MTDHTTELQDKLDYFDTLLERLRISLSLIDEDGLESIDPSELEDMAMELKGSLSDLEHAEYVLDQIDELSSGKGFDEDRHIGVGCAHCGDTIEHEHNGTGSPLGSMHKRCAHSHMQQNPKQW